MSATWVTQKVRPRVEDGCDWDAERRVLIEYHRDDGNVFELWLRPGHSTWNGIGQARRYIPQCLMIADLGSKRGGWPPQTTEIGTGRIMVLLKDKEVRKSCMAALKMDPILLLQDNDYKESTVVLKERRPRKKKPPYMPMDFGDFD